MVVTGFRLQNAVREAEHMKNLVASQWDESLNHFEGEEVTKSTPLQIMEQYRAWEDRVVRLQLAQAEFNLAVLVTVQDRQMTLCEAVKRVGGAGRAEKMWRGAGGGDVRKDSWTRERELTRNKDEIRAVRSVTIAEALEEAKKAARYAAALREAIAVGNGREVEITWLEPLLFE